MYQSIQEQVFIYIYSAHIYRYNYTSVTNPTRVVAPAVETRFLEGKKRCIETSKSNLLWKFRVQFFLLVSNVLQMTSVVSPNLGFQQNRQKKNNNNKQGEKENFSLFVCQIEAPKPISTVTQRCSGQQHAHKSIQVFADGTRWHGSQLLWNIKTTGFFYENISRDGGIKVAHKIQSRRIIYYTTRVRAVCSNRLTKDRVKNILTHRRRRKEGRQSIRFTCSFNSFKLGRRRSWIKYAQRQKKYIFW